jgi:hypothetical protein
LCYRVLVFREAAAKLVTPLGIFLHITNFR